MDNIWVKIFEYLLEYGVLGIVAYQFFKTYEKLINNILKQQPSLKDEFVKLRDDILEGLKYYDITVDILIKEMRDTKNQLVAINTQIMNSIIDDRALSHSMFIEKAEDKIKLSIKDMILNISRLFDTNGFVDDVSVSSLKENLIRTIEKYRNGTREKILGMTFDKNILKIYAEDDHELWIRFLSAVKYCISNIDLDTLREDKNYKRIKTTLSNKLEQHQEDLIVVLKESIKKGDIISNGGDA